MDRAGLERCDRAALIEIIVQQREMIERLVTEVAESKEAGQPPKTPGNSSVPPSMGFKPNRAERRARKRRRGRASSVGVKTQA